MKKPKKGIRKRKKKKKKKKVKIKIKEKKIKEIKEIMKNLK